MDTPIDLKNKLEVMMAEAVLSAAVGLFPKMSRDDHFVYNETSRKPAPSFIHHHYIAFGNIKK